MKKRVVATMLAAVLTAGMITGCGNTSNSSQSTSEDNAGAEETAAADSAESTAADNADAAEAGDVPVVTVVMPSLGNTDDVQTVEDAINEIMVPAANAQVKLTFIDLGAYSQQTNLMMTDGDGIDIFWINKTPASFIDNGQLLELTDYWNNADDNWKSMIDDYAIEAAEFSGHLYTIPSIIERSHEWCLEVNKEMLAETGIENDNAKIWTLDEIHDLLLAVKEKHPDIPMIVPQTGQRMVEGYTWEGMGDTNFIGVVEDYGSTGQVISLTDCQDFIDIAHTMREWYQEGLIMQDILSNTNEGGSMVDSGKAFGFFEFGCEPDGMKDADSYAETPLTIIPNWIDGTCGIRMGWGISANTKDADAAWRVLEQLYTNDDVIKLYSYGVENVHYVLDENGQATFPDGVTADSSSYNVAFAAEWGTPATRACTVQTAGYPFESHMGKDKEYDQEAFAAGRVTGALGAVFDSTSVADEYSACLAVRDKYYNSILSGAVDPDENIAAFKQELKDAGEDVVIAAKQELLDSINK